MFPRSREDKVDVGVDATVRLGSTGRCALDSVARRGSTEREVRHARFLERTTASSGVTSRVESEHPKEAITSGRLWRKKSMTNPGIYSRINPWQNFTL